jgi:hypothetical protein
MPTVADLYLLLAAQFAHYERAPLTIPAAARNDRGTHLNWRPCGEDGEPSTVTADNFIASLCPACSHDAAQPISTFDTTLPVPLTYLASVLAGGPREHRIGRVSNTDTRHLWRAATFAVGDIDRRPVRDNDITVFVDLRHDGVGGSVSLRYLLDVCAAAHPMTVSYTLPVYRTTDVSSIGSTIAVTCTPRDLAAAGVIHRLDGLVAQHAFSGEQLRLLSQLYDDLADLNRPAFDPQETLNDLTDVVTRLLPTHTTVSA